MSSIWQHDELEHVSLAGHHLIRYDSVVQYALSTARLYHDKSYAEFANWPEACKHMEHMAVINLHNHQVIAFLCKTPTETREKYDAPTHMWYSFGLDVSQEEDKQQAGSFRNFLARKLKGRIPQVSHMIRKTHYKSFHIPDRYQSQAYSETLEKVTSQSPPGGGNDDLFIETYEDIYQDIVDEQDNHDVLSDAEILEWVKNLRGMRSAIIAALARKTVPTYDDLLKPSSSWNNSYANEIRYVGRVPDIVKAKMQRLRFNVNADGAYVLHWTKATSIAKDPTYNQAYSNCADLAKELANVPCSTFGIKFLPSQPKVCKFDRKTMPPDFSFLKDMMHADGYEVFFDVHNRQSSVRMLDGLSGCLFRTDERADIVTHLEAATDVRAMLCTIQPPKIFGGWRAMLIVFANKRCFSVGVANNKLVIPAPDTETLAHLRTKSFVCVKHGTVTAHKDDLIEAMKDAAGHWRHSKRLLSPTQLSAVKQLRDTLAAVGLDHLLDNLDRTDFNALADALGYAQ